MCRGEGMRPAPYRLRSGGGTSRSTPRDPARTHRRRGPLGQRRPAGHRGGGHHPDVPAAQPANFAARRRRIMVPRRTATASGDAIEAGCMREDDRTPRLAACLLIRPRDGGDPVVQKEVELPPAVTTETFEGFVRGRYGPPLAAEMAEHSVLGAFRIGCDLRRSTRPGRARAAGGFRARRPPVGRGAGRPRDPRRTLHRLARRPRHGRGRRHQRRKCHHRPRQRPARLGLRPD